MQKHYDDLIVVLALTLISFICLLVQVLGIYSFPSLIKYIPYILLLLLLPGYAILSAENPLFIQNSIFKRVGLAVVVSLILSIILALLSTYTPLEVFSSALIYIIIVFTISLTFIAIIRRKNNYIVRYIDSEDERPPSKYEQKKQELKEEAMAIERVKNPLKSKEISVTPTERTSQESILKEGKKPLKNTFKEEEPPINTPLINKETPENGPEERNEEIRTKLMAIRDRSVIKDEKISVKPQLKEPKIGAETEEFNDNKSKVKMEESQDKSGPEPLSRKKAPYPRPIPNKTTSELEKQDEDIFKTGQKGIADKTIFKTVSGEKIEIPDKKILKAESPENKTEHLQNKAEPPENRTGKTQNKTEPPQNKTPSETKPRKNKTAPSPGSPRRFPYYDLLLVLLITAISMAFILVPGLNKTFWNSVLGFFLMFFLPGYVLIALIYPRMDDIDVVMRLIFSFGVSYLLTAITGLILNYVLNGILNSPQWSNLNIILLCLSVLTLIFLVGAFFARRRVPLESCFVVDFGGAYRGAKKGLTGKTRNRNFFSLAVLVVVLFMVSSPAYDVLNPPAKSAQAYTEFYVLGPNGNNITEYPTNITSNENGTVTIVLVNHENTDTSYQIVTTSNQTVMDEINVTLKPNEKREIPYNFTAGEPAVKKLEFLLYKLPDLNNVYLSQSFILNIISPPITEEIATESTSNEVDTSDTTNEADETEVSQ